VFVGVGVGFGIGAGVGAGAFVGCGVGIGAGAGGAGFIGGAWGGNVGLGPIIGATGGGGCIVGLSGAVSSIPPLSESPMLSQEIKITKRRMNILFFEIIFFIGLIFIPRVLPYEEDTSKDYLRYLKKCGI